MEPIGDNYYIDDNMNIFYEDKIVSRKFLTEHQYHSTFPEKEGEYYIYHEGPLVRIFLDERGIHFSNEKKINCKDSHFFDENLTFGKLFADGKGCEFLHTLQKENFFIPGRTLFFMLGHPKYTMIINTHIPDHTQIYFLCAVDLDGSICWPSCINRYEFSYKKEVSLKAKRDVQLPKSLSYESAKRFFTEGGSLVCYSGGIFYNFYPENLIHSENLLKDNKNNLCLVFFECADSVFSNNDEKFRSYYITTHPCKGFYTDEEIKKCSEDMNYIGGGDEKFAYTQKEKLNRVFKLLWESVHPVRRFEIYQAYRDYLSVKTVIKDFINNHSNIDNLVAMEKYRKVAYCRLATIMDKKENINEILDKEYGVSLYRMLIAIKNIENDKKRMNEKKKDRKEKFVLNL